MSELQIIRDFMNNPPFNAAKACQALGIDYSEAPLKEGVSHVVNKSGNAFGVIVALDMKPQRRRFAAAHMIAHYLLHRDLIANGLHEEKIFEKDTVGVVNREYEMQANSFALNCIMPVAAFTEAIAEGNPNAAALAKRFDVSVKAAELRLRSLNIGVTAERGIEP